MKKNELDRRALKTRHAIHEALYSLMQEKKYSKITIQNIIDRANVGRSTFYSHYTTKDELLLSSVEHILEMLNQYIESYGETNDDKSRLIPVVELFEHIKENNKIIKGLMKSEGAGMFFENVQSYWNTKIEEFLKLKLPPDKEPKVPVAILASHISSTFTSLLIWWLNSKMVYTPAQMDQFFRELINPCIDSVIYDKKFF